MSKFHVILLILVAAILVVAIIVASVVLVDYRQRQGDRQRVQEMLEHKLPELEKQTAQAYRNAASTQLRAFKGPLAAYRLDVGKYPSTLRELRDRPANTPTWDGPYLDREIPSDPWGNPYQYRVSGDEIELWSFGPDGKDGTADDIRDGN